MPINRYLKLSFPLATALAAMILSLTAISALADGPTIDTQDPTAAISTVLGPTTAAKTGHSIATGDVNGDGFQDLIVGAPFADVVPTGVYTTCTEPPVNNAYIDCVSGGVYLYLGRPGLSQTVDLLTQPANVTFYAPPNPFSGEELGRSVATGDLNGDNIDDIIMGANHYGSSPIGAALVWVGRTSITTTSALSVNIYANDGSGYNLKVVSAWVADFGGWDVAAGDINNDGFDDLLVGMPVASVDTVTDTADPPTDTTSYHPPDYQRYHLSSLPNRSLNGAAYVSLGSSALTASSAAIKDVEVCLPELTIYGQNDNDFLGRAVTSGDLDGDGYDDFIVSAANADADTGKVYVFFGSALASATCGPTYDNWIVKDLVTTTANITLTGITAGDWAGYDLSTANLNNDAFDDLIIGAPFANGQEGQVYVVYGRARASFPDTLSLTLADVTVSGAAPNTWLGTSVTAGNLNNDPFDDLLLGAPAVNPHSADLSGTGNASAPGAAYALFGGSLSGNIDLSSGTPANLTILGAANDDWLGRGLGLADFNDDGFNDLAIGAAAFDPSARPDAGTAYVINLVYPQTLILTPSLTQLNTGNSVIFTTTAQTWLTPTTTNVTTQSTFAISPAAAGSWTGNAYTAANPGTWIVTATFNSRSVTTSLTVLGPPVPSIACNTCTSGEGQPLSFDASATLGNPPLTFSWSFGDGAVGSGQLINHPYPDNGAYTATLTVQDTHGLTSTLNRLVTITNQAPTLQSVTNSGPIVPGSSVTLTVSATDVPSDTLTYAFDCDNNATFEIGPQASNQAACLFASSGAFTVNAQVADEDGGSAQAPTTITVFPPPTPTFTCGACTAAEGQPLPFDASATTGNPPFTFTWAFGDGAAGSGQLTNHPYPDNGPYTATLTVRDTHGLTSTLNRLVTITNLAPTIQSVTNSGPVTPNQPVTLTVTAADVPSDTLTYAFDCDNNATFEIGPQASNQAACSFAITGTFTVSTRTADDDGGSNLGTTLVTVQAGNSSKWIYLPIILR